MEKKIFASIFGIFLVISCLQAFSQATIILKPIQSSPLQAGFVFVQGAEIPANNYVNFSTLLQKKFNGSLWVAILQFPADMPDPLQIGSLMQKAFVDLKANGFVYTTSTPFFFAGHSLGGVVLMNYLLSNYVTFSGQFDFRGTVLEGSFVQKSKLNATRVSSFPPVFTLGAELDGLARITRLAESFYYDESIQTVG